MLTGYLNYNSSFKITKISDHVIYFDLNDKHYFVKDSGELYEMYGALFERKFDKNKIVKITPIGQTNEFVEYLIREKRKRTNKQFTEEVIKSFYEEGIFEPTSEMQIDELETQIQNRKRWIKDCQKRIKIYLKDIKELEKELLEFKKQI